jgi:hypothetical protein
MVDGSQNRTIDHHPSAGDFATFQGQSAENSNCFTRRDFWKA